MENITNIEELIVKYISGDPATVEEKERLLQWLERAEENRKRFGELCDLWLGSNLVLADDLHTEAALARLTDRIEEARRERARPKRTLLHRFTRIAAAVTLLLASVYTGYRFNDRQSVPSPTINRAMTADRGKARFILPDGSVVWLNANSTLEYPEMFTGGSRVVQLSGEALFEVTRDENAPFIVRANGMEIEVLGTRFLVQNYPGKSAVEAVLVEGSVKVGGSYFADPTILTPGQLLSYDKGSSRTDIRSVNSSNYTSWIDSQLVFDNTLLADIIINLQKWYGVEIVAPARLSENTRLSFIVRSESLNEIMEYMSLTVPASYRWEEGKLYLFTE